MLDLAFDDKTVPDTLKETYLKPALCSSRVLLFLINDILDYSRLNANKLSLIFLPADMNDIVREAMQII